MKFNPPNQTPPFSPQKVSGRCRRRRSTAVHSGVHPIAHGCVLTLILSTFADKMADETSAPGGSTDSSTTKPALDKDFYNWSTFFSLLTGTASNQAAESYFKYRDDLHEEQDCKTCNERTEWLLKYSPIVRFLRQNINKLGQDINETNIHCRRCTTKQSGGFDPEYGILICANQLRNRGHQEDTMAHEMVHAWDFLRFKYNDPKDLRHAACTEVHS